MLAVDPNDCNSKTASGGQGAVEENTEGNLETKTSDDKSYVNNANKDVVQQGDVDADVEKSYKYIFGDTETEGKDYDYEGGVEYKTDLNFPECVFDVCSDIDSLYLLLKHQVQELEFLLKHATSTARDKNLINDEKKYEKFATPNIRKPKTIMGNRRYRIRAVKSTVAFQSIKREMNRMRTELRRTRVWLLGLRDEGVDVDVDVDVDVNRIESKFGFADHVVLVLQYAELILGSGNLASPNRISCQYYKAQYDGITVSDTLKRLRKKGTTWRVHGDIDLISSRLRGLNESLQMIYCGRTCAEDDIVIGIATGKIPFVHPEYGKLVLNLYDIEKASRHVTSFLKILMLANASTKASFRSKTMSNQIANLTKNTGYYGCCFPHRGQHQGEVCYTGTDEEVMTKTLPFAKYMWNLPEKKLVKQFYMMGLPRIKHSIRFEVGTRFNARLIAHVNIVESPKNFDQIRLNMQKTGKQATTLKGKPIPKHRAIILHFHGGGFISMSAFAHENYTRLWAKQCKVPIVSVNYSLAPQHQFPKAVNEAFEAYKWCREVAGPIWGTEKIVLVGDSAGGNLVASVAVRCLQEKFPLPFALMPVYPALDLRRVFSPSMLLTLNDKMIPYLFLQACLSAYLGSTNIEELHRAAGNPLASPYTASDDIISQFPRCHFVAASLDPLLDNTIRFCDRMNKLCPSGTVSMSIVPQMIHGFLSLNWPIVGVKEVLKLIKECGEYLDALIEEKEIVPGNRLNQ